MVDALIVFLSFVVFALVLDRIYYSSWPGRITAYVYSVCVSICGALIVKFAPTALIKKETSASAGRPQSAGGYMYLDNLGGPNLLNDDSVSRLPDGSYVIATRHGLTTGSVKSSNGF